MIYLEIVCPTVLCRDFISARIEQVVRQREFVGRPLKLALEIYYLTVRAIRSQITRESRYLKLNLTLFTRVFFF